jgi:large subunit ribosomal protein L21
VEGDSAEPRSLAASVSHLTAARHSANIEIPETNAPEAHRGLMYAIIVSGGKQYRVAPDQVVAVEKLTAAAGDTVVFDQVALVVDDSAAQVGRPWVEGARVTCRVLGHGRGRKVEVFTYKAKDNSKRNRGHRQSYTSLKVEKISVA